MKVSTEAGRLAKYKEKKKEISVVTLQFDVTFCTPILCALSIRRIMQISFIRDLWLLTQSKTEGNFVSAQYLKSEWMEFNIILCLY